MNIAFFGMDEYSLIVFDIVQKYCQNSPNHQISTVLTHRPKPEGRGYVLTPSPVDIAAKGHDKLVLYYGNSNDSLYNIIKQLKKLNIDLGIIASFGHILPPLLIKAFPKGLINIHPSLLPQYRNVTPVQYALALGDEVAGVTVFEITADIDSGRILAQIEEPIKLEDTNPSLSIRLFQIGSQLLLKVIENDLQPLPQAEVPFNKNELIFTKKFNRNSGYIKWPTFLKMINDENITTQETNNDLLLLRLQKKPKESSQKILHDLWRALVPWPEVWTEAPTKKGSLRLTLRQVIPEITVQLPGKPNPITWSDFSKYYL